MRTCIRCKEPLSINQILYSHGRCPKCGYKGEDAGSIVEVETTIGLFERIAKLLRLQ